MLMDTGGENRYFHEVPSSESETIREDVDWILGRLRVVGIQRV